MSAIIFIEGGGDAVLDALCREGFRKLLQKFIPVGHQPRLVACGGRNQAHNRFQSQLRIGGYNYIGLLVDSEDPVAQAPWLHLAAQNLARPAGASDDQVLFMSTCMETWCCADRASLQAHYGAGLAMAALPSLPTLETQHRHAVQAALATATRRCSNAYAKGKRSFVLLAELNPAALATNCPIHFVRTRDLLVQHC